LRAQTTAPTTQTTDAKEQKDETSAVKRGEISTVIDIDGYFEPTESYDVRIRPEAYQGDLKVLSAVAPGTMVKKGDKLLDVDPEQLNKQIAAAENELTTANANLAKAQADVQVGEAGDALAMKMQQTELSNAESALKWWEEVDGAHLLKNAELAVKSSRDNVEDQGDELEQLQKMYKSEELTNATADIVVKRAIRALERAKIMQGMQEAREGKVKGFDYNVARQKLEFAIEQQKQQLAELAAKQQQQSALRKTALAGAQQAAERAQMKFDDLKKDLDAFAVEAPFDGVALAGEFNLGRWHNANPKVLRADEKLQPGQVVMTLVPAGKLRLMLEVPENKLQFVKFDAQVRVIPTGAPEAATEGTVGKVPTVAVTRDRDTFFATPVTLAKVDPRLAPAQRATAQIAVEAKNVLVVPASAVSKNRVKVKTADDKSEWRDVITGYSDGESIEIREGLSEGEQVFTKAPSK
jgi:multidrug resistance efflux pump